MAAVVAIQPALPRPAGLHAAPIHAFPSPSMNDKENQNPVKPNTTAPAPANGRGRRERPCDACRRRKSRCVIHEGAVLCVLCEFHRQECTFVQSPQPRKRKLVEQKKDDAPRKRSADLGEASLQSRRNPAVRQISSPAHRPSLSRSASTAAETLGLNRKISRYLGLATPLDTVSWGQSQSKTTNGSSFDLGALHKVDEDECFIMLNDDDQDYDAAHALRAIDDVVAPHGDALIDLYFKIVHPSFPVLQKQIIYNRLRHNERNFSPPLLLGMYILALNWWSHDPRLARLAKPNASKLEAMATKALAVAMQRPKLSTLQGGLLLLQRPGADSWSLTTQLVAVGQELGLHLDCSSWSIPGWEAGLRRRIAWALYMQDKWSSLVHGRPSHIFGANWAVRPISDKDFDETGSTPAEEISTSAAEAHEMQKGKVLFTQMIALTGIMAEITDTFYTQIALQEFQEAGKNSTRLILERAKPLQMRLKSWFASLPQIVKMDSYVAGQPSATGFLHLAYFATEITLHRRIVQSLDTSASDNYMTYVCRSAAKTRLISAMDFVNRLKPEHLQAFWHFAAKINFTLIGTFGSLLWATAPSREEATFYKSRLQEYRWTLSVSSKRADFLDYAVQMLDASRAMLNNLAEKPSITQEHISRSGVPDKQAQTAPPAAMRDADAMDVEDRDDGQGTANVELRSFPSGSTFSGFGDEGYDGYGIDGHERMELQPDLS